MASVPDISLVFPAYNEARRIRGTVAEAVDYFTSAGLRYEIIVAADGDDGTREIVAEMAKTDPAIHVLGRPGRHGKGHGIREGIFLSTGRIAGFADADNKVPISEYGKLAPFLEQGWDMAIGSRALASSAIEKRQPFYRQIGGKSFGVVMRALTGLPISDTQCGFKFFRREVALDLFSRQRIDRYMFDVEILSLAWRLGYRIREVPIRWRDDGDSRLDVLSGNIRNMIDILNITLRHRLIDRPRRSAK